MSTDQMENNFFNRTEVNVDIAYRCALDCPRCQRWRVYRKHNKKVPGYDMTMTEFKRIVSHFTEVSFCGQYSDPIHHPKFIDFLKLCKDKGIKASVHNASSAKSEDWYIQAFKANPNAQWFFGIDGLPHQSHQYRINQDGVKLYNIMLEAKKYLKTKPIWQYIIFNYNENHVEEAKKMADDDDVYFMLVRSSRWDRDDPLMPTLKEYKLNRL